MELFDLASYGVLPKDKKIKLFEAFSGIGTQSMAFKRLGIDFEVVGFSEIDKYAIMSYRAIHGDNIKNYGDISKIEQLPQCDVCTWSYPCQDISLAGNQKGMVEGTRSNYGYEFLETVKRSTYKPKILIMENVKALVSERFKDDFNNIQEILKSMGYENHWKVLNAKHYGVAQNRERVFMISILGGGYFQFPPKIKLKKKLKDYLEDEVDEKYYLNDRFIEQMTKDVKNYNRKDKFIGGVSQGETIARTITTKLDRPESNYIMIPEATKQGYAEAHDGDGVYINRPHQKRGVVQKGMIQTIKTSCDDLGVVEESQKEVNVIDEEIVFQINEFTSVVKVKEKTYIKSGEHYFRIRKLTPREALRLMDVSEYDIDIILSEVSNTQAYKLAGNSIVVNVLVEIFRKLF